MPATTNKKISEGGTIKIFTPPNIIKNGNTIIDVTAEYIIKTNKLKF